MNIARTAKLALLATVIAAITTESFAVDGAATTTLNVRTGPGTGYAVLDTLNPGEVVDVTECQTSGWCMIYHNGPDGWVSGKYLSAIQTHAPAPPPVNHAPVTTGSSGSDDAAAALAFAAILGIGAVIVGSAIASSNDDAPDTLTACPQGHGWHSGPADCRYPPHTHRRHR